MKSYPETIMKHAYKLNVSHLLKISSEPFDYKSYMNKKSKRYIQTYITNNPNSTVAEFYKRCSDQIIWATANMPEWLESIYPFQRKLGRGKMFWCKQDENISRKIEILIHEYTNTEIQPLFSFFKLSQAIGYSSLKKNIEKLPQTKKLIEKNLKIKNYNV